MKWCQAHCCKRVPFSFKNLLSFTSRDSKLFIPVIITKPLLWVVLHFLPVCDILHVIYTFRWITSYLRRTLNVSAFLSPIRCSGFPFFTYKQPAGYWRLIFSSQCSKKYDLIVPNTMFLSHLNSSWRLFSEMYVEFGYIQRYRSFFFLSHYFL